MTYHNQNLFQLNLQTKFYHLVGAGKKTVEGRLYKEKFHTLKPGDHIQFSCEENRTRSLIASLVYLHRYDSFQDMLIQEGLERSLPGIASVEEGVKIYHSFPGYAELEKQVGVIALGIKLIQIDNNLTHIT